MASLKVLMMGGQRVGKSSALAAIMDALKKIFSQPTIQQLLQKLMAKNKLPLAQNCKK